MQINQNTKHATAQAKLISLSKETVTFQTKLATYIYIYIVTYISVYISKHEEEIAVSRLLLGVHPKLQNYLLT